MRTLSLRDLISSATDDEGERQYAAAATTFVPAAAATAPSMASSHMKGSIGFLLGPTMSDVDDGADVAMDDEEEERHDHGLHRLVDAATSSARGDAAVQRAMPLPGTATAVPSTSMATKKKRKARICKETGCQKYVVDHGLCIRHGGGKRCSEDGCDCRAQNRGLCWKHGGFTICKIDGCTKRAKSRGICWSHGGGTRCKDDGCTKIAVSHGKCWAHGGGKRCIVDGCRRPASERTDNYCSDHFGCRLGLGPLLRG